MNGCWRCILIFDFESLLCRGHSFPVKQKENNNLADYDFLKGGKHHLPSKENNEKENPIDGSFDCYHFVGKKVDLCNLTF